MSDPVAKVTCLAKKEVSVLKTGGDDYVFDKSVQALEMVSSCFCTLISISCLHQSICSRDVDVPCSLIAVHRVVQSERKLQRFGRDTVFIR